jgi:predicted PurR-regulated permease PerM
MKGVPGDLTRSTLAVVALAAMLGATLWILRPFIGPAIWAAMVVVATWPLMLRVQARLWGRRWLAVMLMTVFLLLLFVVPLTVAIGTIVGNADQLIEWARLAATWDMPAEAPPWVLAIPFVGELLGGLWEQLEAAGLKGLLGKLSPYAGNVTRWFVAEVGNLGFLLLQFLLTVLLAAVMYAQGEEAASLVRRLAFRLAGTRGADAAQLAGDAIRGVALGVGVTALLQAVAGGLALALTGVPFAGLLTALMFMLCIAQIGPAPVLVPAVIWLFWSGQIGWAITLAVITGAVVTLDNVIRPLLIRMGADLPLMLIFAGVIGGLLAFGLVGIFVGPVVLAVTYTLLLAWADDRERQIETSDAG